MNKWIIQAYNALVSHRGVTDDELLPCGKLPPLPQEGANAANSKSDAIDDAYCLTISWKLQPQDIPGIN